MSASATVRKPILLKSIEDYRVAIVVALPKEKDAVDAILEYRVSRREARNAIKVSENDNNQYTFGVLENHHVVVALLPGMGKVNAASAATSMRMSFPNIKLCLLVGICGLVPSGRGENGAIVERFLGDVVIAETITQYDYGKGTEGGFVRKSTVRDVPGRVSTKLQNILADLDTFNGRKELEEDLKSNLQELLNKANIPPSGYPPPEQAMDIAFPSNYVHRHRRDSCTHSVSSQICEVKPPCPDAQGESCAELGCETSEALQRGRRPVPNEPKVFVGMVGVADLVQKSAKSRDDIAAKERVVAFEMESVGVWDNFPDVVVIKAGCDYADSHKNDVFHRYASATSAACAKAFLERYRLDGNVIFDDLVSSHDDFGADQSSSNLQSPSIRAINFYNGHFSGSNIGHNGTINNKW